MIEEEEARLVLHRRRQTIKRRRGEEREAEKDEAGRSGRISATPGHQGE